MSLSVQWGVVAKSDASGSYTFVLPVAVSNVLVATSAIKGWNNTDNNLCWHCVGTTSASEVVTYQIAVSQVYCLLLTTKATTFRYSPWPTAITTKSFQAVSDSEPAYWLLVAK